MRNYRPFYKIRKNWSQFWWCIHFGDGDGTANLSLALQMPPRNMQNLPGTTSDRPGRWLVLWLQVVRWAAARCTSARRMVSGQRPSAGEYPS
jgi:hypothetical protein